jgi:FMN phosphatase YigB (HAD superfamily)
MIKTIAFDLGGVIITIDNDEPIRRFRQLGAKDADRLLDPYMQSGFFGDLETGAISEDEFIDVLSSHIGSRLTWQQCQYAWKGFVADVPVGKLKALERLRAKGYRLILVSNTNGFMQAWADSADFSEEGKPLSAYFDCMYRSYEMRSMKPSADFFSYVIEHEKCPPSDILFVDDSPNNCKAAEEMGFRTFCPGNGEPWEEQLNEILK